VERVHRLYLNRRGFLIHDMMVYEG
jgi:hypothetical protein